MQEHPFGKSVSFGGKGYFAADGTSEFSFFFF